MASEVNCHAVSLDLKELTLVDRESVLYLRRCEDEGVKLANCAAYVRDWIDRERRDKARRER